MYIDSIKKASLSGPGREQELKISGSSTNTVTYFGMGFKTTDAPTIFKNKAA
jgi:hypothetical protein